MYVCMQCMYVKNATPLQVDPCRWIPLSLKPTKTRGKSNCWTILPSFEHTPATANYLLRSTHQNYIQFSAEKVKNLSVARYPSKKFGPWNVLQAPPRGPFHEQTLLRGLWPQRFPFIFLRGNENNYGLYSLANIFWFRACFQRKEGWPKSLISTCF